MLDPISPPPAHPPRLLEVHEVAFVLKCSHETVLRYIRQRTLVGIRLGPRSWRVDPVDLQKFIDANRVSHSNGDGHGTPPPGDARGPDNGSAA